MFYLNFYDTLLYKIRPTDLLVSTVVRLRSPQNMQDALTERQYFKGNYAGQVLILHTHTYYAS